MKKKTKLFFVFSAVVFAVLAIFSGCDMDLAGKPLNDASASAHDPSNDPANVSYLTIFNLPAHVAQNHISNVSISNQLNKIGGCLSYNEIIIENDAGTSTIKIPLVYTDTSLRFDATGSFFISLDINIDALTRLTIADNEYFPLDFVNGSAWLDAALIGFDPSVPCLTIVNLPPNTRKNHFSNVFVYNSTGVVAKSDYNQIIILKNNNSVTAKIPVSYNTGSEYFKESGTFVVSFTINIDYATYYHVKESDKLRLYFTDGNAVFDASLIPPPPPPYLTITSLPANTKPQNISNVFVYNAAGTVIAKCADYDQIIVTRNALSVTARIPLYYNDRNEHFTDTGDFIVSFFINIDFSTQIIVKKEDKLTLFFAEGSAELDASIIPPAPPPPYLTINSLPRNAKAQHFSNVFVYNSIGTAIARCPDYNQIIITTNADYAAARIPLVYSSSGDPFRDSGNLVISFSLYIDSYIQVAKTRDDSFSVAFTEGSGAFDLIKNALASVELGYFSGGLNNPWDNAAPIINNGTRFEMNGYYYTVNSNMAVVPSSFSNSCIVYVYARLVFNQIEFVYRTTAPAYDSYKKGYYNGFERALFKFVFIRDSSNKYFSKTFINDNWSHLRYQTVDAHNLASQNLSQYYYLSGTGNPQSHTLTFPAGVYLITLNGARGGGNSEYAYNLFNGGHISEVIVLSQNTSFTFFTGEKSGDGASGGSGSFAFSPDGYLLCAGGGGGRGDGIPGAGGSIGGGGAGIGEGSSAGTGGGINGGRAGRPYGITSLTVHSYSLGFYGGILINQNPILVGSAAYFDLPPPHDWLNTNGANGRGFSSITIPYPYTECSGGNNRNSVRGNSTETNGNGSVTVHKIN